MKVIETPLHYNSQTERHKMARVVITDFINDDLAPERMALDGIATVEAYDATG